MGKGSTTTEVSWAEMRHFWVLSSLLVLKGTLYSKGFPPLLYSSNERGSSSALCLQGGISLLRRAGTCNEHVGTSPCPLVNPLTNRASTAGILMCFLKQFSYSNKATRHFYSKPDIDEYSKAPYRHSQCVVAPFYEEERDSHHHLVL